MKSDREWYEAAVRRDTDRDTKTALDLENTIVPFLARTKWSRSATVLKQSRRHTRIGRQVHYSCPDALFTTPTTGTPHDPGRIAESEVGHVSLGRRHERRLHCSPRGYIIGNLSGGFEYQARAGENNEGGGNDEQSNEDRIRPLRTED